MASPTGIGALRRAGQTLPCTWGLGLGVTEAQSIRIRHPFCSNANAVGAVAKSRRLAGADQWDELGAPIGGR